MNQETLEKCCKNFEEMTHRKITEVEKRCLLFALVEGETYASRRSNEAYKLKNRLGRPSGG
jgi:hypothetical protein